METNNPSKTEYIIVKCNCELYQLSSVVTKEINWLGRTIIEEFKNFVCEGSYSYCLERKNQLEGMKL